MAQSPLAHQPRVPRAELRGLARTRSAWWLATFFGTGYLRPGPGTYGSVAAALLWLGGGWLLHGNVFQLNIATAVAAVLVTLIGIPASTRVAHESGREDPGFVVIDEVAGQLIALLLLPPEWPYALLGVLLFRFFDILKPPPVRQLERLPEGTGIMLDDVAAGVLALVAGQAFLYLLHRAR